MQDSVAFFFCADKMKDKTQKKISRVKGGSDEGH
jgi:hypothetical protein